MKANEIRGYILTAFALISFIVSAPGWVSLFIGFGEVNFYYVIWVILTLGFTVAAIVCFVKAYNEIKYPGVAGKSESGKILYRAGQGWTELNMFQLKLEKVSVHHNSDGYFCEAAFTAENWRTELKNGGNQMQIEFESVVEGGNEVCRLSENKFIVDAGKHLQIPLTLIAPEHAERVLIKAIVIFDDGDALYKAQFEFYPGHYTR